MASIPARARELCKMLDSEGIPYVYVPAFSPGYSHSFDFVTDAGKPFAVLVEKKDNAVFAPKGKDQSVHSDLPGVISRVKEIIRDC